MTKLIKTTFILLIFILLSCNNKNESVKKIKATKNKIVDKNAEYKPKYKGSGKLVPIDLNDKKYIDVNFYCKDTLTQSGWKIEYLVKNDKTKYDDLYIKWSKGNLTGLFCCASTLLMRSYFIPKYKGENESHIFLTHGCSTEGEAILTLPKNTKQKGIDYSFVVDYDIKTGKIGYIPERSFSLNVLEIEVVNLKNGVKKPVVFKNICLVTPEESCIDKMTFEKNLVEITATLIDKNDKMREKTIVEKHMLEF